MNSAQDANTLAVLPGRNARKLSETLHRALILTGASGVAIALKQDGAMITRARAGWNAPDLGSSVDLENSFAGLCVKTGRTLYCDHLEADARANATACRALNVASMVVTPVREAGAIAGVLAAFSRKPNAFTDTHRLALEALAWALGQEGDQRKAAAPPSPRASSQKMREHRPGAASSPTAKHPEPRTEPPLPVARPAEPSLPQVRHTEPALPQPPRPVPAHWGGVSISSSEPERKLPETSHILRFHKSERMLHWSIALPFLVCFSTALILVIFYNPHPQRHFRLLFSLLHRISGACLIVFPALTAALHRKDHKIHFYNIREAWTWVADDVKWLFLMGAAAISSKVSLPEQGKFNAAEKLNFIMVMCTYPLFIATGLVLSLVHVHILSWMLHVGMAAIAAPLMLGHIFMATINPETRVGITGMLNGYVDRHWARHHYTRWYREHFEPGLAHSKQGEQPRSPRPAPLLQCPSEAK